MPRRKEEFLGGLSQILGGLTGLVDRLESLAEHAQDRMSDGEIRSPDGTVRGVYGFQVKVGLGENGQRDVVVEPFGHTPRAARPATEQDPPTAAATPAREPIVDVFDEQDAIVIVAELPGIAADDVTVTVDGDVLWLKASTRTYSYEKELLLPRPVDPNTIEKSGANGVVEIRCPR